MVKQGQFERLSGNFARVKKVCSSETGIPATLKDWDDQGVRLHLIGTLALNGNLHYYRFCHVVEASEVRKKYSKYWNFQNRSVSVLHQALCACVYNPPVV
jgi:hypothetical protein